MSEWIAATEGLIQADVVRWTEGVYQPRRRKNAKAQRIGERQVVAEVVDLTKDGWLRLLVRYCIVTRSDVAHTHVPHLPMGTEIKRALKTIKRGKPERMLWSDESARRSVTETSRHQPS